MIKRREGKVKKDKGNEKGGEDRKGRKILEREGNGGQDRAKQLL